MAAKSLVRKAVIGLVVAAVFAALFLRSVRSVREEPFEVDRGSLSGWTLVQPARPDPVDAWLAVSPPPQLASALGRDIFQRGGESVYYPSTAHVPLVLESEFDRALAGRVPPDRILDLAREAGLESALWEPRCMGHRRVSGLGVTRAVYFVLFEAGPFERFRQQLAALVRETAGEGALFDPLALSPVLIVAGLDSAFNRWMPLRADAAAECLAPVETSPAG